MKQVKGMKNDGETSDKLIFEQNSEGMRDQAPSILGEQSIPCRGNSKWQPDGRALALFSQGRIRDWLECSMQEGETPLPLQLVLKWASVGRCGSLVSLTQGPGS